MRAAWPAKAAGPLVGWALQVDALGRITVTTHHLGPALGPSAAALLGQALGPALGSAPIVVDAPLDTVPVTASPGRISEWVDPDRAATSLSRPALDGVIGCIRGPRVADSTDVTMRALHALPGAAASQVHFRADRQWSFQWQTTPCGGNPPGQ